MSDKKITGKYIWKQRCGNNITGNNTAGNNAAGNNITGNNTAGDSAERALLVSLQIVSGKLANRVGDRERSLDELNELAATAGVDVAGKILQKGQA